MTLTLPKANARLWIYKFLWKSTFFYLSTIKLRLHMVDNTNYIWIWFTIYFFLRFFLFSFHQHLQNFSNSNSIQIFDYLYFCPWTKIFLQFCVCFLFCAPILLFRTPIRLFRTIPYNLSSICFILLIYY